MVEYINQQSAFVTEHIDAALRQMVEETLQNKQAVLSRPSRKFLERIQSTDRRLTRAEEREIHLLWTPEK